MIRRDKIRWEQYLQKYNPQCNSIDVYTSAGYMLRIDCWEAEKDLKTTPGSDMCIDFTCSRWTTWICEIISWGQFTDVGRCRRFTWIIGNLNKSLYLIFDWKNERDANKARDSLTQIFLHNQSGRGEISAAFLLSRTIHNSFIDIIPFERVSPYATMFCFRILFARKMADLKPPSSFFILFV